MCIRDRFHLDSLRKACQVHGFHPQVGYEIQSTDLVYGLLAANRGVAVVPVVMGCHMIATHPNSHICIRAIADALPPVIIGVGTLKNQTPTQATDLFLQFLKDTLLQEEQMVRELGYGSLL